MTRQAFAKARENIDPQAFINLNDDIISDYEKSCKNIKTYKGYRLIAVDGSTIDLPNNEHIREYFGCSSNGSDKVYAKGLAMAAYDVLNLITIFAELYRYDDSEKVRIISITEDFSLLPAYKNALFLLDRGYPSFNLFEQLQNRNQCFLVRVSENSLKEINESTAEDSIHEITRKGKTVKVRVLNVTLPTGDKEKLVTNLFDMAADDFVNLYAMRWGIETQFNFIKNKQMLEVFTGESVTAVRQDFYAAVLMQNMTALAYADQEKVLEAGLMNSGRALTYKANMSQLIYDIKVLWVKLFISDKSRKRISNSLNDYARILAYSYACVPDRHYPRNFANKDSHKTTHPKSAI